MLLKFPPRHARASAGCRVASSAKTSSVISFLPRSAASFASGKQRAGGIPRSRHPLTVESSSESAEATAPVPPRASMTRLGESSAGSMPPTVVCTVQTCQGFASRKTTITPPCGPIGVMTDPPHVIGPRLRALRLALGQYPTQVSFALAIGVDKSTYNPWEKGTRALTFEAACVLRKKWGIPLDYLFYGANEDRLPSHILARLEALRRLGKVA